MSKITQNRNESVERMISRFRRVVLRSGHLKQIRRSRYFKKDPSQGMAREKAQFREFRREQRRKQSK
jgi:ribosomal protein S21